MDGGGGKDRGENEIREEEKGGKGVRKAGENDEVYCKSGKSLPG